MDVTKIIVDRITGDVLSGHHRLKVLREQGVEITEEMIEYVNDPVTVIHQRIHESELAKLLQPTIEPDAYGRTGDREDCHQCSATGVEYGETCVTCGGYGWVRQ